MRAWVKETGPQSPRYCLPRRWICGTHKVSFIHRRPPSQWAVLFLGFKGAGDGAWQRLSVPGSLAALCPVMCGEPVREVALPEQVYYEIASYVMCRKPRARELRDEVKA